MVNAYIEIVVPLDVSVDADAQEKLEAVEKAFEHIELRRDMVARSWWEIAEEEPAESDTKEKHDG